MRIAKEITSTFYYDVEAKDVREAVLLYLTARLNPVGFSISPGVGFRPADGEQPQERLDDETTKRALAEREVAESEALVKRGDQ